MFDRVLKRLGDVARNAVKSKFILIQLFYAKKIRRFNFHLELWALKLVPWKIQESSPENLLSNSLLSGVVCQHLVISLKTDSIIKVYLRIPNNILCEYLATSFSCAAFLIILNVCKTWAQLFFHGCRKKLKIPKTKRDKWLRFSDDCEHKKITLCQCHF